jgi:hypothetical protein
MAEVHVFSAVDAHALLLRLRRTDLNFDPADLDTARRGRGWRVDRYCRELAAESAGDPVPGGPWSIASDLSTSYAFVDPLIVRSFYDPPRSRSRTGPSYWRSTSGACASTLACVWAPSTT